MNNATTTPPAEIREARESDLGQVLEIYGWHVLNGLASFEEAAPSLDEFTERWQTIVSRGLPYVVADSGDGKILGYAYAGPYRTRPAYRHSVEDSVYVAPDAARQGLGSRLLAHVIADCESRSDIRQMVAVIGNSGNDGSIGLHARLGFEMVGTLKSIGFKHGGWVDSVLMQCSINDGDSRPPD